MIVKKDCSFMAFKAGKCSGVEYYQANYCGKEGKAYEVESPKIAKRGYYYPLYVTITRKQYEDGYFLKVYDGIELRVIYKEDINKVLTDQEMCKFWDENQKNVLRNHITYMEDSLTSVMKRHKTEDTASKKKRKYVHHRKTNKKEA